MQSWSQIEAIFTPLAKDLPYSVSVLIDGYDQPTKASNGIQHKFAQFEKTVAIQMLQRQEVEVWENVRILSY